MNRIRYDMDCLLSTHCLFSCLGKVFMGLLCCNTKRSEDICPCLQSSMKQILSHSHIQKTQQLRNTGKSYADLLTVSVPINVIMCGNPILKCVIFTDLFLPLRVMGDLISYRSAFIWNLDKQISILISHKVHIQANIQNYKKCVNLYVNASALKRPPGSCQIGNKGWIVTRSKSPYGKEQLLFAS